MLLSSLGVLVVCVVSAVTSAVLSYRWGREARDVAYIRGFDDGVVATEASRETMRKAGAVYAVLTVRRGASHVTRTVGGPLPPPLFPLGERPRFSVEIDDGANRFVRVESEKKSGS